MVESFNQRVASASHLSALNFVARVLLHAGQPDDTGAGVVANYDAAPVVEVRDGGPLLLAVNLHRVFESVHLEHLLEVVADRAEVGIGDVTARLDDELQVVSL